jgi:hypothetical protein
LRHFKTRFGAVNFDHGGGHGVVFAASRLKVSA